MDARDGKFIADIETGDHTTGEPTVGRPGTFAPSDSTARSESLVVRVTPSDKARLVWLADHLGVGQSDLARRALQGLFREHGLVEEGLDDQRSVVDALELQADALRQLATRIEAADGDLGLAR
jgi:hypothetical protein